MFPLLVWLFFKYTKPWQCKAIWIRLPCRIGIQKYSRLPILGQLSFKSFPYLCLLALTFNIVSLLPLMCFFFFFLSFHFSFCAERGRLVLLVVEQAVLPRKRPCYVWLRRAAAVMRRLPLLLPVLGLPSRARQPGLWIKMQLANLMRCYYFINMPFVISKPLITLTN